MSRIWWEWYCSLFPSSSHEPNDPTLRRCRCGYTFKFNRWQLLKMYLFGEYIHTCPQCLRKSRWKMITYVVRKGDNEMIKRNNRLLE